MTDSKGTGSRSPQADLTAAEQATRTADRAGWLAAAQETAEAAAWSRGRRCPGCSGPAVVVRGAVRFVHAETCRARRRP
jgi:hypothetical protein